ncbi:hypothetical protein N7517_006383 [Penicillium concentricum]|uniref:Uncharacterized protein n=1 Tax=Penicillium concentricum TaxID=293559 RepID=A0A9W9S970_9EURO|nr:uncharacterized protein N7517_006383 [Penicillium concentricum]KAJ5374377.1 hypothetical protein N7517_006383 [Penicillium concentricum]
MDTSESEYEQLSLPSGMRKRKRTAGRDSSQARKKRKPALDDLRKLLVTYHGLQQMRREVDEKIAACEQQIAKHKFGSISGKSRRRRRGRQSAFRRVGSPLREVVNVGEDPPTFWVLVGEWVRSWW